MINKQNSVSVIIPVFNRLKLIPRSMNSVINQTYPVNEIIVVDDGSNDGTYDMIKENFPQAILIYQENRGVSSARNIGIQAANSKWIAFLDSDDEWMPNKIEEQISFFIKNPLFKVCHTDEIWIRNGVRVNQMKKHRKYGGEIYKKCLPLCVISPSSIIIHKDIFNDVIETTNQKNTKAQSYYWLGYISLYHEFEIDLAIEYFNLVYETHRSSKYNKQSREHVDDIESYKNLLQEYTFLLSDDEDEIIEDGEDEYFIPRNNIKNNLEWEDSLLFIIA